MSPPPNGIAYALAPPPTHPHRYPDRTCIDCLGQYSEYMQAALLIIVYVSAFIKRIALIDERDGGAALT